MGGTKLLTIYLMLKRSSTAHAKSESQPLDQTGT